MHVFYEKASLSNY